MPRIPLTCLDCARSKRTVPLLVYLESDSSISNPRYVLRCPTHKENTLTIHTARVEYSEKPAG